MCIRAAALACVASALLTLAAPLRAQTPTTGNIEGAVLDEAGGSLPGVSIEVVSPSLQGSRVTASDARGRYHFLALAPGTYRLRASLAGFTAVEKADISLALSSTVTLPLTLRIAKSETVDVSSTAPVVDTASVEGGLNIRQDVVNRLPLGRNYTDVVFIVPGVAQDNAEVQGRGSSFTVYGATSLENVYLIDGANTTNVIRGFQGKALPQEYIEEVQVKTSGYAAEFGHATGGIVNVVTKSGGNDYHGDAFLYRDDPSLTAGYKGFDSDAQYLIDKTQARRSDFGADTGGYILKDRIWLFGAYNRVTTTITQMPLFDRRAKLPVESTADVFAGKLTYRAGPSTTLVGSIFGDPEKVTGNLENLYSSTPSDRQGVRKIGGIDYTASVLQLLGSTGLATTRYTHHQDRYTLRGATDLPQVIDARNPDLVTTSGGFGFINGPDSNNTSRRDAGHLDGTLYLGAHEVKGGLDYEDRLTEATPNFTGGQLIRICAVQTSGCPVDTPAGHDAYYTHTFYTTDGADPAAGYEPAGRPRSARTHALGAFLQDGWKAAPGLTLSLGLRYDQERMENYTGATMFDLKDEWQPRVGIAWDPARDGSSRVSASYGRYYYSFPNVLAVAPAGNFLQAVTRNFEPTSLAQDPALVGPRVLGGDYAEHVAPDLRGMYIDELTVGFDKAIDKTLWAGIRYTYRNLGRVIDDRCDLDVGYPEAQGDQCVIFNPGSSSLYAQGQFHGCDGRDYLPTDGNPPESACYSPAVYPAVPVDAKKTYHAIELVARKQVGTSFWAQASYVYTHLRGNYDGAADLSCGCVIEGTYIANSNPGISEYFDYPLTQTGTGPLNQDRPHSFRLSATYTAPFGLTAGFTGYVRSGAPREIQDYFNSIGYTQFTVPRGEAGRQPTEYDVNLSLGYTIKMAPVNVNLFVQGFNLLDTQTIENTDFNRTIGPPGEPDNAYSEFGKPNQRHAPRKIRLGARLSF